MWAAPEDTTLQIVGVLRTYAACQRFDPRPPITLIDPDSKSTPLILRSPPFPVSRPWLSKRPMVVQCCTVVADADPTLNRHRVNAPCLLGCFTFDINKLNEPPRTGQSVITSHTARLVIICLIMPHTTFR